MNTYNKTIPYFYIIRNKETGIMYAGSRWKNGCIPEEFMVENGYLTSSPTIQSIIKEHGLGVFEILRIDTHCDGLNVYDYETAFLECNNCSKSDDWYNKHNNWKIPSFGSDAFKDYMYEKFNVKNCMELESTKEKIKQTNLEKYGFDSHNKSPIVKQNKKNSYLKNFGVSHPSKVKKICPFCNELKGLTHKGNCKHNPNKKQRKHHDINGKNNPMAKTYLLFSPNGETHKITGNIHNFCKQNGLNWNYLRTKKSHKGWSWKEGI